MKEKKLKRIFHKGRTTLLGGKRKAEKLRIDAANIRREHDLCLCCDEEVYYASPEEDTADKDRPMVVCEDCGKRRLRVALRMKPDPKPTKAQAAFDRVRDLGVIDGLLK